MDEYGKEYMNLENLIMEKEISKTQLSYRSKISHKYIQNSVLFLDFLSKSPVAGLQVCHASITPASPTSSMVSLSLTLALHRFKIARNTHLYIFFDI